MCVLAVAVNESESLVVKACCAQMQHCLHLGLPACCMVTGQQLGWPAFFWWVCARVGFVQCHAWRK